MKLPTSCYKKNCVRVNCAYADKSHLIKKAKTNMNMYDT
jgi:hypothetical protein